MCVLCMGPLADQDPQNIPDPRTDCGTFVEEKLGTQILILDRNFGCVLALKCIAVILSDYQH